MRSIKAIVFGISLMVLVVAPFTLFDSQVWYKQFWGEKFYEEQELRMEALVLPDGSMSVRETRVLSFHGDFSRYRRNIPLVGYSNMVDVQVSEPNKPYTPILATYGRPEGRFQFTKARVGREDQFIIELFFNARDEKRTFIIEYRVLDVVKVHNDVAELNWKFIGNQRSVEIDRMSVALNLPPGAGAEEVKVWGHGPLKGDVRRVSPEQLTWQTTDLPTSRFLEGRVIFPTRLVPQGRMLTKRDALSEILLQEKGWADLRSAEQQKAIFSLVFSAVMTVLGLFFAWWLHQRYGKKFRLPMEVDYYRELPGNYTPAEAGWFLSKERLDPKVMAATFMDLARRGYLRMEPTDNAGKQDIVLRQLRPAGEELAVHERLLLDFFFNQVGHMQPAVWFSSIKEFRKADPGSTKAFVDSFRSVVSASVDSMNFFDRNRSGQGFAYLGLFISIAMVVYYQSDRAIFQTFGSILTMVAFITVIIKARDLTEIGQNQYDLWMAFRRFLKDFSNLDRAQLPQLILWEHYLVYAVVLGVAAEVIKQLPFVYPQVNEPNNDFGYYWGGMYHTGYGSDGSTMSTFHGLSTVDSMVNSLNSDWDNALSGLSGGSGSGGSGGDSGGGDGGGFSGGGGDGGGGGGGDAD